MNLQYLQVENLGRFDFSSWKMVLLFQAFHHRGSKCKGYVYVHSTQDVV